jgi:hypothetical protein
MDRAVAKIDPQIPFDDDERLVSVFVIMPDEVSLQLHYLELVIVHLSDHFWLPLLMEQAKLLHKADCLVFHPTSVTLPVPSSDLNARPRGTTLGWMIKVTVPHHYRQAEGSAAAVGRIHEFEDFQKNGIFELYRDPVKFGEIRWS